MFRCTLGKIGPILAITLLFSGPGIARASFITSLSVVQTPTMDGLIRYDYTLSNDQNSDSAVILFDLRVGKDAQLSSISRPAGWNFDYTPTAGDITWSSPGPDTDIAPGSTGLFSFLSPLGASPLPYLLTGLNEGSALVEYNDGRIASPNLSAVPEPSSFVPMGTGAVILLGYALRRRQIKD